MVKLLCGGFWLFVLAAASAAAAEVNFQHGETVMAMNKAAIDAPLRRHPKALWYELANLRKESNRFSPLSSEIALDFRRDEGASGCLLYTSDAADE